MKKIGLLLALMPCFSLAESELIDGRWFKIHDNPTLLIDLKTAKSGSVWVKTFIPKHERAKNFNAHYFLVRSNALCHSNKIKVAEGIWFDEKNRLIKHAETNFDYEAVIPNTIQETLFEVACRK